MKGHPPETRKLLEDVSTAWFIPAKDNSNRTEQRGNAHRPAAGGPSHNQRTGHFRAVNAEASEDAWMAVQGEVKVREGSEGHVCYEIPIYIKYNFYMCSNTLELNFGFLLSRNI